MPTIRRLARRCGIAGSERQTPIPSAVFRDGRIFLSRGYRNSDVLAIRPGGRGDVSATHVDWTAPNGASYVPSIVHYDGLLYMTNEVGIVTALDASTGAKVWQHRLGGVFFASPVAGDGKVYFVSETGETFVLKAGRTAEVLATNDLGERFLASPAIAAAGSSCAPTARCSPSADSACCEFHSTAVDNAKKTSMPRLSPAPASSILNGCGSTRSISEAASMHTSGFARATHRGYIVLRRAIATVSHAKPTEASTARTP